jgi:hypothetical protein
MRRLKALFKSNQDLFETSSVFFAGVNRFWREFWANTLKSRLLPTLNIT